MPPRRDTGFVFPPELTQLIQQQNALMQLLVQNQGNNNNNNIIIDDTDSDPNDSDDDYVDEAGADVMESSTDQYF